MARSRKFENVRLEVPVGLGHSIMHPQYRVRTKPGASAFTEIQETKQLYVYGEMEKFITELREAANGWMDVEVEVDTQHDYYDSVSSKFLVTGWREMTAKEKATVKDEISESKKLEKERQHKFERSQYDKLKSAHPEWFQDDEGK